MLILIATYILKYCYCIRVNVENVHETIPQHDNLKRRKSINNHREYCYKNV